MGLWIAGGKDLRYLPVKWIGTQGIDDYWNR
jgi:hypothetical protein